MSVVMVTRTSEGYEVARTFRSQAAAQRALNVLLEINETAYEPISPLDVVLAAAEADDPEPHDGRLFTKLSDDEE